MLLTIVKDIHCRNNLIQSVKPNTANSERGFHRMVSIAFLSIVPIG